MGLNHSSSISNFFYNKKVLITGSSGYLGWNLINEISKFNCTIFCCSRNENIDLPKNTKAKIKKIKIDYQDEENLRPYLLDTDIVYHLASQTSIYKAEENSLADFESNVKPLMLILEICRIENIFPIIIFTGTSTQCGMKSRLPISEKVEDVPITIYDFHKLQSEKLLEFYCRKKIVQGTTFRLTNVYGPGPKSSSKDRGILNIMIKKALRNEKLTIYGDGEFIRDYVFIDDVIWVLINAPNKIEKLNQRHFVLGSGEGKAIYKALELISNLAKKYTDNNVEILKVKPPEGLHEIESRNFIANIRSLNKAIGYKPIVNLENGIELTLKHYLNKKNI